MMALFHFLNYPSEPGYISLGISATQVQICLNAAVISNFMGTRGSKDSTVGNKE